MTERRLPFHFSLSCIGEGNGNPLQCSCLENPRDRGAWWASVYGVAQSRTWLKWLSSSSSSSSSSEVEWAFQVLLMVKNPPANSRGIRDTDSIPGSGRSPGGGHGNPLQYSCLENPMDRRAWCATVQRVKYDWSNWACTHSEVEDAHTCHLAIPALRSIFIE